MSVMRVFLAAMIVVALTSCTCGSPAPVAPRAPSAPVQKPPAPPKPPAFDLSFESEEQVATWVAKVKFQAEAGKDLPDAKPYIDALAAFKPPTHVTALFDKPIYPSTAGYPPGYTPDPVEAKRLEEEGEHWEAGKLFAELKDLKGVRRCAEALKEKGEWKVVPILAAHIGNQKLFDLAIDTLVQADRTSDVMSIFIDVVKAGRKDFVKAAMTRNKIDPTSDYDRADDFAYAGWIEPMCKMVTADFKDAENLNLGKAQTLRRILKCTFVEKDILLKYLQQPEAEVFLYDCHCGGEGGSETEVMHEAAELWKAVAKDTALRDAYTKAVKQQLAEPEKNESEGGQYVYGALNPLDALGPLVYLFDEARTDAAWAKILGDGLIGATPYVREIGRLALGQNADAKAEDLEPRQRYVVAWFSGAQTDGSALAHARYDYKDIHMNEVVRALASGTLAPAEMKRVWKLVGLPEDDDALRIAPKDHPSVIDQVQGMDYANADTLRARLIYSGAGEKALPDLDVRDIRCTVNRDRALDCHRNYKGDDYQKTAFAAVSKGLYWDGAMTLIVSALHARMQNAWQERSVWKGTLGASINEPYATVNKNRGEMRFSPIAGSGPRCSTPEEADTIVGRAVDELREVLDVSEYEAVLLDLVKNYHRAPYDAEIARRVKVNDIAGLARLKLPQ